MRKRILTLLVAVIAVLAGISVHAATYDIYVCGVQVTDENAYRVLGDGIQGGRVKYTPSTKTLKLERAILDGGDNPYALSIGIDGVTIQIEEKVYIKNGTTAAININGNCTIEGLQNWKPALNIFDCGNGISIKNGNLTVKNTSLRIDGGNGSMIGIEGKTSGKTLSIESSYVRIARYGAAIQGFSSMNIEGCDYSYPSGAVFDSGKKAVVVNGEIASLLEIRKPGESLTYDLRIGGSSVSDENKDNFIYSSNNGTITGKIKYDAVQNKLYLDNVDINTPNVTAIQNQIPHLEIYFKGTTNKAAGYYYVIESNYPLSVTGDGPDESKFEGTSMYCIYLRDSALDIKNISMNMTGTNNGLAGDNQKFAKVRITGSDLKISGPDNAVNNIESMTLRDCGIINPVGAKFDPEKKTVVADGVPVKELEIKKMAIYDLFVGGVQVTGQNKNNITGPGITGSVSYDPQNNILKLTDAKIEGRESGIVSNCSNLQMEFSGKVEINSENGTGIETPGKVKLCGVAGKGSSVNIRASSGTGIFINDEGVPEISDMSLKINANKGISGPGEGSKTVLNIKNADADIYGKSGCVLNIDSLETTDCFFTTPHEAVFNPALKAVTDKNGNMLTVPLHIRKSIPEEVQNLSVGGVPVTSANAGNITGRGISGTVTYDEATKTLTLKDATVKGEYGIVSNISGLRVKFVGKDTIAATRYSGIISCADMEITGLDSGNSRLYVSSPGAAVLCKDSKVTVSEMDLKCDGSWGIRGNSGNEKEQLTVKNSSITVEPGHGAICCLSGVTFENSEITKPVAAYDPALKGVADSNGIVTAQLEIKDKSIEIYRLQIGGVFVTSKNKDNITGDEISGHVSYNPEKKLLTMKDAVIQGKYGLELRILDLEVSVEGKCYVMATDTIGMISSGGTVIKGKGIDKSLLDVRSRRAAVAVYDDIFEVENVHLKVQGLRGITGNDGNSNAWLQFRNCKVSALGDEFCLGKSMMMIFEGCEVMQPWGAAYDKKLLGVALNGEVVRGIPVIIKNDYEIKVAGIPVTKDNASSITGPGISGEVSYDVTTNSLNLNNATVETNAEYAVESADDINIAIEGKSIVKGTNAGAFRCDNHLEIIGKPYSHLTVESPHNGIALDNGSLKLQNLEAEISADKGICGINGNAKLVLIENCDLDVNATSGAITAVDSLSLNRVTVLRPENATFDSESHQLLSGGRPVGYLVLRQSAEGLVIAGNAVDAGNCRMITGDGISGNVYYDNKKHCLYLEDAEIVSENGPALETDVDGLEIRIRGKVRIQSKDGDAVRLSNKLNIIGESYNSYLDIEGKTNGIVLNSGDLHIENINCYIYGKDFGILGDEKKGYANLTSKNADISLWADKGCIVGVNSVEFGKSLELVYFDPGAHGVIDFNRYRAGWLQYPRAVYNIYVNGSRLTSCNASRSSMPGVVSGKISYNPNSKCLTLDNAVVEAEDNSAIKIKEENVEIRIRGDVRLSTNSHSGIFSNKNLKITGEYNSNLTATSGNNCGIYGRNCTVEMNYVNGTITAPFGLAGYEGADNEKMILRRCNLKVSGTEGTVCDLSSFTLEDCEITNPAGAAFDSKKKGVVLNDSIVTGLIEIASTKEYAASLSVAGIPVTDENAANITGEGITGKVSYDAARKCLILENAEIVENSGKCAIENQIPDLNIEIKGDVSLMTYGTKPLIYSEGSLKIVGAPESKLTMFTSSTAIDIESGILELSALSGSIDGGTGISGNFRSEGLSVDNCRLVINARYGAITGFKAVNLRKCQYSDPTQAFDPEVGGIGVNGTPLEKVQFIVKDYGLTVAGVPVSDDNADNITGPGITGKIYYLPQPNVLVLENATISDEAPVVSDIDGLYVHIIGNSKLESTSETPAISSSKNFTISGSVSGSSNLSLVSSAAAALDATGIEIEIINLNGTFEGVYGIAGFGDSVTGKLFVNGSNLKVTGTSGAICHLANMGVKRCSVSVPVSAGYDKELHGVALNGKIVEGTVEISGQINSVEDAIFVETENLDAAMYNVMGQRISKPYNGQIYIQNGRKKVWRE